MLNTEKFRAIADERESLYVVGIKATTQKQYDKIKDFLVEEGCLNYAIDSWDIKKSKTVFVIDQDGDFTTLEDYELDREPEVLTLDAFKKEFCKEETEVKRGSKLGVTMEEFNNNVKKTFGSGDPKAAEGLVSYEVKDMNIIHELKFGNVKIWIQIDHRKQDVSFVEFNGNTQKWEPKRWLFSARGEEYLNGWQNILDAMKHATEYGRAELRKGKE